MMYTTVSIQYQSVTNEQTDRQTDIARQYVYVRLKPNTPSEAASTNLSTARKSAGNAEKRIWRPATRNASYTSCTKRSMENKKVNCAADRSHVSISCHKSWLGRRRGQPCKFFFLSSLTTTQNSVAVFHTVYVCVGGPHFFGGGGTGPPTFWDRVVCNPLETRFSSACVTPTNFVALGQPCGRRYSAHARYHVTRRWCV